MQLAAVLRSVLHHLELERISDERLARLAAAVRDLDAVQHDMNGALAELVRFTADAQPASVFVREIQDMLHNTGYSAALFSLADLPGAAERPADGRADLVRASYPGQLGRLSLLASAGWVRRA
jgi:hypothetical protein